MFRVKTTTHCPSLTLNTQSMKRHYDFSAALKNPYGEVYGGHELATPVTQGRYSGMTTALDWQTERIRAMSADQKFQVSHALWLEAQRVMSAGVRANHPDWSDAEVASHVRLLMRDADA